MHLVNGSIGQRTKEVDTFPVQDVQFALYLQHLAETTDSKTVVEGVVNAVLWTHQMQVTAYCCLSIHMYGSSWVAETACQTQG